MPDHVLLEELHLTRTVRRSAPDAVRETARRTVNGRALRAAIRRAVQRVLHPVPALGPVRVALSA